MAAFIRIIDNIDNDSPLPSALSLFGESEVRRLEKIKNPRRRAESATGMMCLKEALEEARIYSDKESFEVVISSDGRPSFERADLPDFSISHDGRLSAAVFDGDGGKIGIDIALVDNGELLSESRKRLAERFFDAEENEQISESEHATEEFFIIWTKKEAYAKQCGRGLSKILAEGQDDAHANVRFSCFDLRYKDERYILTICTEHDTHTTIKAPEGCDVSEIIRE